MTLKTANLGYPRIGKHRELKFALEACWTGKSDQSTLLDIARQLRAENWRLQAQKGLDIIPSNDFSLYDHVLDTATMVGAIPAGYHWQGGKVDLTTYFAMARGATSHAHGGCAHGHAGDGVTALEMTKWFDTNYHYLVPELHAAQQFALTENRPLSAFAEAKQLGIHTRPVLLGPVTFLKLSKTKDNSDAIDLLDRLLPVYAQILQKLSDEGCDWVQIDEPCLALDLSEKERGLIRSSYATLFQSAPDLDIMLATYFGPLGDNLETALGLPVSGLHIDVTRGRDEWKRVVETIPAGLTLSLGVIDGRNVWRADLTDLARTIRDIHAARPDLQIQIAPSSSLLHVPIDAEQETDLDAELRSWLSFATQKLEEISTLRDLLEQKATAANDVVKSTRLHSPRVNDPAVAKRLAGLKGIEHNRKSGFAERQTIQEKRFRLPPFPTTTIGSFPQTPEVRKARSAHGKGAMSESQYRTFLEKETASAIRWQEDIGLDVLVHGEFERNDMVQYFGEQLSGFAFTTHAWVQSYGSRYVRPPIIYGDVSRPRPMTVGWWQFAQAQTNKPMKGMLTGPVTILNWSFVRDDLPRETVCRQIALAIRDEVIDLEKAGAGMIQIDEAALREGLPLRRADWQYYLDWAVECFRICASNVADETQIHTHMCYSEFNDIMAAITAMDADVISIETSRSKMELLDVFKDQAYPNEIGPGVYDIHSPRVPEIAEMESLLTLARQRMNGRQLWVNPDCGLKTRKWEEVKPALVNMVEAAKAQRTVTPERKTASV